MKSLQRALDFLADCWSRCLGFFIHLLIVSRLTCRYRYWFPGVEERHIDRFLLFELLQLLNDWLPSVFESCSASTIDNSLEVCERDTLPRLQWTEQAIAWLVLDFLVITAKSELNILYPIVAIVVFDCADALFQDLCTSIVDIVVFELGLWLGEPLLVIDLQVLCLSHRMVQNDRCISHTRGVALELSFPFVSTFVFLDLDSLVALMQLLTDEAAVLFVCFY